MTNSFPKPVMMAPAQLESVELNDDSMWEQHPEEALALAHETAQLLIDRASRGSCSGTAERLLSFSRRGGLETIGEVWSRAEPASLPGALWRLVLMHHHVENRRDVVADLVENGLERLPTIDPVVAGLAEPVSVDRMLEILEEILSDCLCGKLAPALRRASALASLVSAGLLNWPARPHLETATTFSALHWDELSRVLAVSARREEMGELC